MGLGLQRLGWGRRGKIYVMIYAIYAIPFALAFEFASIFQCSQLIFLVPSNAADLTETLLWPYSLSDACGGGVSDNGGV